MQTAYKIAKDNVGFLGLTRYILQILNPILQNEKLPHGRDFADMIRVIGTLNRA